MSKRESCYKFNENTAAVSVIRIACTLDARRAVALMVS